MEAVRVVVVVLVFVFVALAVHLERLRARVRRLESYKSGSPDDASPKLVVGTPTAFSIET